MTSSLPDPVAAIFVVVSRMKFPHSGKAAEVFAKVIIAAAALTVAGAACTGCSSVGDRGDAAAAVAMRLLTAVDSDDGTAACATLAPDTLAELEQSAKQPCAQAILDEDLPAPGTVTGREVYGQWAQIRLTDDTLFLAAFPGGWRVVAAGCTPRPERPYDCELQGG
jgi:hypothetical protein